MKIAVLSAALLVVIGSADGFAGCSWSDACKADPIGDPNGTPTGAKLVGQDPFGNNVYETDTPVNQFRFTSSTNVTKMLKIDYTSCDSNVTGTKPAPSGTEGYLSLVNKCGFYVTHQGFKVEYVNAGQVTELSQIQSNTTPNRCGSAQLGAELCKEK